MIHLQMNDLGILFWKDAIAASPEIRLVVDLRKILYHDLHVGGHEPPQQRNRPSRTRPIG